MKKMFFVLVVVGIVIFFGCGKNLPDTPACTNLSPNADSSALLQYAHDSSIQVTRDSSGIFYRIIDSGNNLKPIFSSNIRVNYVVRTMSGYIIDSASNSNLNGVGLYGLIPAWQIGLPKIGVGGEIIMLVPSALAYGCAGYPPVVPSNTPLYFDVKLLQVN
ncbi:MAG TPA: FKBP-type peptidyl-prolyl cis-trans isomerase [Puia sp.]|jgi:FKBP-type peptidyl-prolyl cis-trans isomerase FkpA